MRPPLPFPRAVTQIHGRTLPAEGTPAGYGALIAAYNLAAPLPRMLFAIGARHRIVERDGWKLLTPRHAPRADLEGHLTFAFKYEGLDLGVLSALFSAIDPEAIETIVRAKPTGGYARRIWFLYEWLTGSVLDVPPLRRGSYVNALNPALQYPGKAENAPRQRVRNNLPGTPAFCPLVFRTEAIERFVASGLAARAQAAFSKAPQNIRPMLAGALAMAEILPDESRPNRTFIDRWYCALSEPDCTATTADAIARLIGEDGMAEPAGPLLAGMRAFEKRAASHLDPVLAAACMAFGFASARKIRDPAEPVHRYVVTHTLGKRGFGPRKTVLPFAIIAADHPDEYKALLRVGPGDALFDATPHASFLYRCLQVSAERFIPAVISYILHYRRFLSAAAPLGLSEDAMAMLFERLRRSGGVLPYRLYAGRYPSLKPEHAPQIEYAFRRTAASDPAHC
ncbi:MAG: hypothetical protein J0H65_04165 [Rhizobiales bacterium]|nr:hypothetical protein [Hyphomicrobiales bacterium]